MNKKKLLLIMIVLLSILIIGIIVILNILKDNKEYQERKEMSDEIEIIQTETNNQLRNVESRNDFYIVKNCVTKFFINCMEPEYIEKNTDVIYNLLDQEYINFKNITKENLSTIIPQIKTSVIDIMDMYVSEQKSNLSIYIVNGILREKVSGELSEFQIMLKIDTINKTFSVFLKDYIEETYKDLQIGNNITAKEIDNVEKNENNRYDYKSISDDEYVNDLFNKYKEEILYNSKLVYNHLDEEYKDRRFDTLEKFQEYAKDNVKNNVIMKLEKYNKTVTDNYTQYICIDQKGKTYIFRETAVMNYSLILDTYTLDLPEFIEEYNQATTMEKVGYNIQKCLDAINEKDYSYVYGKLDEEFKNNNYKTEEGFIKEIKNKLFNTNEVTGVSTSNEGNTYIYNLTVTDTTNENNNQDMMIIMQLREGTDFVMSFSFQ